MDLDEEISKLKKDLEKIAQAYNECIGAIKYLMNKKNLKEKKEKDK